MSLKDKGLLEVFFALKENLGPMEHWWPAETPFEVVIGAMLTQQTKWPNVKKAIDNLKGYGLLEPELMACADIPMLEECIRCCGFYRQKAERLKLVAIYFAERGIDKVFALPVDELRREMLALKGVGNETADSIVLYAAGKPRFVIDAYTTRMMKCMGLERNYMELQGMFESALPEDVDLYKEYHALIVEYAKMFCSRKRCSECIVMQ